MQRTTADEYPDTKRVCPTPAAIEYVSYSDPCLRARAGAALRDNGVVVITGVLAPDRAEAFAQAIISNFRTLCPWLGPDPTCWERKDLPPQSRSGLFQQVVCNFPAVWELRTNADVRRAFAEAVSGVSGRSVAANQMYTSIDGINFRPPNDRQHHGNSNDWAHVDQTRMLDNPLRCVQGQVVLHTSTAAFVCSPGSHRVVRQLVQGTKSPIEWHKFPSEQYPEVRAAVEAAGGQWQVPVHAAPGSMILWLSSTIHSAKLQDPGDRSIRCVVYTCYRPKDTCALSHWKRLRACLRDNRATNHWGTRMFGKGTRFPLPDDTRAELRRMVADPASVYEVLPVPPSLMAEIDSLM